MFQNAGKKLRIIIQISFIICVCVAFFVPIGIMYNSDNGTVNAICCLAAIVLVLLVYFSHLIAYSFAELCENVYELKKKVVNDSSANSSENVDRINNEQS